MINTIPRVISVLQSTEAIKYLSEKEFITNELVNFDVRTRDLSSVEVEKNHECLCCGEEKFQFLEQEIGQTSHGVCGREAIQINPHMADEIVLEKLAKKLEELGNLEVRGVLPKIAENPPGLALGMNQLVVGPPAVKRGLVFLE